MIYVISDLHGYQFERFTELLRKADFSENDLLYVLGDVIDRGEDGIKYLLWLREQKNAHMLLGNHELMMRSCSFLFQPNVLELMKNLDEAQKTKLGLWMANKAEPTVRGLFSISQEERETVFDYVSSLPVYETVRAGGREYLLTHSGMRGFEPQKSPDSYSVEDLVWNRPEITDRYFEDKTTVFGHTPTFMYGERYAGRIVVTDTWIDIDAGAGYGISPVLLRLDDMEQFVIE